ncbi:MAG: hypothetical protein Q9161_000179 [Pseudevernia consocians]
MELILLITKKHSQRNSNVSQNQYRKAGELSEIKEMEKETIYAEKRSYAWMTWE